VSQLDDIGRDAGAFCRVCDYPLFWIRAAGSGEGEGGAEGDPGLRRLPGTGGLVTVATLQCWKCDERNAITGVYCIRCGVELHPTAVIELPPPPPPEPVPVEPPPPPPPPKPPLIPYAWVPALVAAIALLLWCIVGVIGVIVR
jgi:hypothetical protein